MADEFSYEDALPAPVAVAAQPQSGVPALPPPGPDPLGHTYLGGDPTQGSSYSTPAQDRGEFSYEDAVVPVPAPPLAGTGTAGAVFAAIPGDAWRGLTQPLRQMRQDAAETYHRPPTPAGAAAGFMDIPRLAGDALGVAGAGVQAGVNAAAGVLSRALPSPKATHTDWQGIIPHTYVDGNMTQPQAQQTFGDAINTALQGARPTGVNLQQARVASQAQTAVPGRNLTEQNRAIAPQMPLPQNVPMQPAAVAQRLKNEKTAAYAKVDNSGFTFQGPDIKNLADTLEQQVVARGGPEAAKASPQAFSMIGRLRALASQPAVTLSQIDRVRSDVYPLMMDKGGPDAFYGKMLREGIDGVINGSNAPYIAEARAANTRYEKASEVANRLRSAELQAGRANSGDNLGNAIRQKLSPMIDPLHSAEVTNLTPAEQQALEHVVVGDPKQNALRRGSNMLRNPFMNEAIATPLGFVGEAIGGHGMAGALSGGAVGGMQLTGHLLRRAAENRARSNVDNLLGMIAGAPQPAAPVPRISSIPRAALGAGVLAAPLVRQPGGPPSKRKTSR